MKSVRHGSGRAALWIAVVLALMLANTDRATARQYEILTKAEQTVKRSFFSGRDVKAMTEILRLSERQRAAAQELVQAYQTSCRELSDMCDELWLRLDEDGEHSHWTNHAVLARRAGYPHDRRCEENPNRWPAEDAALDRISS